MNSPVYLSTNPVLPDTAGPMPTGYEGAVTWQEIDTFRHWDFTVGKPSQYNFFVRDKLAYVARAPVNPWPVLGDTLRNLYPIPEFDLSEARPLFRTLIIASKKSEVSRDTLWLKARDYAAHCLVTPEIGGGKDRRMRPFIAPYNQEVRTITVPYDYDGYRDIGLNYGDGMPDRWEEAQFPTEDIRNIRPFVTITSQTGPSKTDFDKEPEGRGFDGDLFCNFAEYRGLVVAVDSTDTHAGHRHQRLDPQRKTVILHVRENMGEDAGGDSVLSQMPGYIYKLQQLSVLNHDTVEIYFTDSIRFRREPTASAYRQRQDQIEHTRFVRTGRDVNFNRAGAGLWYYGFGAPISYPMSRVDTIRAVTFWKWKSSDERQYYFNRFGRYPRFTGITWGKAVFGAPGDSAFVPNTTTRALVNIDRYIDIRDSIYGGDTPEWRQVFPRQCKRTIAHEFGHSVGMQHLPPSLQPLTIMSVCDPNVTSGPFCRTDSTYSDSSKAQFSIKESQR